MSEETPGVSPNGDEPIPAADAGAEASTPAAPKRPRRAATKKEPAAPRAPRKPRAKKTDPPAEEAAVVQPVAEIAADAPEDTAPLAVAIEAEPAPALETELLVAEADAVPLAETLVQEAFVEAPDAEGTDLAGSLLSFAQAEEAVEEPVNPLIAALSDDVAPPAPRRDRGGRRDRDRNRGERGDFPRAEARDANGAPAARGELIFVPEAHEETPPPFPDGRGRRDRQQAGLPPITPELLAEVRGEAGRPGDPFAEPIPYRLRGKQGPHPGARSDKEPRSVVVHPAGPEPPPEPEPALILVQDALLDVSVAEWVAEEWETAEAEQADQAFAPGGRRRRRRGRDRDRDRAEGRVQPAETETAAPPAPAAGPIILGKPDEEPYRHERDRRGRDRDRDRDRDKDKDREAQPEQREYKEILINVEERETRIAVLESGRLVELHVEREERVVGGIYKARVSNVLPGMDAAFVDIGLERNAFLYVGDILFDDPKSGGGDSPQRRTSRDVRIKDLVKPGQELLVQVVKGPRGTKGARVSTKISLPGRYLVLMPDGDHLGVSRKIDDVRERDRLKKIADQLQPKGFGLIVRTEAEGRTDQELRQDLDYLVNTWQRIAEKNARVKGAALIQPDLGIVMKTIRDLFGSDVDKLVIDAAEEFEKVQTALTQLAPDLADRIQLYDEREPMFIRYNIEEEIDRLLRRKVWLRNGAYLLIDTTEALTTIDVNTGKFVGTSSS